MALSFSPQARRLRARSAISALAAGIFTAGQARAQQDTFHLDRLEVPGAPDDGMVLFRPQTQQETTFYAQLGLGYSLNPLHTGDVTNNSTVLKLSSNPITNQVSTYLSAGMEFFDRLTIGFTLPVAWIQTGNQLQAGNNGVLNPTIANTTYQTGGPAAGDTRIDAREIGRAHV